MPESLRNANCLALHGLGGGPYELSPLLEALRASGMELHAPVLAGHEGPGPEMPESSWEDWYVTAETAYELAGKQPPIVIGFSTGATLALLLASRKPVSKLILIAPFLEIRYLGLFPVRPEVYLRPLVNVLPQVPRRPPAVRDPVMRRWAQSADRFQTFSLRATVSALDLIELVKPLVPQITVPTLIIQGELDTVVEPSGAAWVHEQLGSSRKELLWFDRSDHLIALDFQRNEVASAVLRFLAT